MAFLDFSWIRLLVFMVMSGSASAQDDLNYIIASSTVAILFFFICFVVGCIFYNCSSIYRSFGYERIPKLELKRREMARRMASQGSSQQYLAPVHAIEKDNVSWVQRWQDNEILEERQDAVMQLGPEVPEPEYRIETTLEDNDPLGPYRPSVDNSSVPEGLYATIDKSSTKRGTSSVSGKGILQNGVNVGIRDSTELL